MTKQPLDHAVRKARARYVAANPLSEKADKNAKTSLPGGNTRAVLHFDPFPLTMVAGEDAELVDLDGHRYLDCVGEYSAGLFGHSDEVIKAAVHKAVDEGVAMGAPTVYERELADLLCARFPSIEQIRFCTSGTEANLLALGTARVLTGRNKVLVFNGGYHGSVINFPAGAAKLNAPFDFILAEYNDTEGVEKEIRAAADDLAAVIVEPVLGAGGNIPGKRDFLEMLRRATLDVGAFLIFDEVKTSRIGPAGLQGLTGIDPDITTLGKFVGGGLAIGAFGGKSELMAHFNPRQPGFWKHSGTFSNNVCSMAAGCAAMSEVYTEDRADAFLAWSESFRCSLNEFFDAKRVPMHANGLGSIFAIHFSPGPIEMTSQISRGCLSLRPLLHMEMLLDGVLICSRGDLFLSLPMKVADLEKVRGSLERFIDCHGELVRETIGSGVVRQAV
jgi:glutamate-1-semialdehyde 2,1-aminomutase